jgi:hypothetical protein
MRLGLETSSIGSRINIFGSEQIRYVTGGITIDSSEITAVDGVKEVKAGTVMGKQDNGLYIPVTDKVAAKLVTGIVGSNNAILWTAKVPGAAGETIKVQLLDPSANNQDLAVSVVGDTVVASLKTGSGGAIESTAAQVIAAVNAHLVAKTLVIAANSGASTGAGVVAAVAATALDNGADWNVTPSCILAEDVDVTDGDTAASAVDHARLLSARLPATIAPEILAVLPGISLV